jgi:signal peptide peptidase SppA
MKHYILNAFLETPWVILPQKLAVLEAVVSRHVAGEKLSAEEIHAAINGSPRPEQRNVGQVAVLPLFGALIPRADLLTEVSGATSVERFGKEFQKLLDDPNVSAIVLDVDSPGGQAGGVLEMSNRIFEARGRKPIVAVANHLAASAAYWIATAADELVVTPSAQVGSIGVFAAHEDLSKMMDQDGIKISLVSAGKYKVEGNPYEPLTDEARASIQGRVDQVYDEFIAAVSRNRGANLDQVRNGFGQGRVVSAQQAVEYGMADRVETLEDTIARLSEAVHPQSLQTADGGQAPVVKADNQMGPEWLAQARSRYLEISTRSLLQFTGGSTVNTREKIQARADKLQRAKDLAELADNETRDFSDEERVEFDQCLADADMLAGEIAKHNDDRERLRKALVADLGAAEPKAEKPEADNAPKVKTLADFNLLSPAERMAFIKGGGQIK